MGDAPKGTLSQRLQERNVHGWRNRVHDRSKARPTAVQERTVENLLLDAIDSVEALQRHNKNLFDELRKWKHRAEQLQMQLDAKTIGELVS